MLLLHILLTILKIAGILLLTAAGLLLLILLALLFVPVTYTVRGDKQRETWGVSARVSWLFGGISATVWHRGQTGWELRLLGIPVRKLMRRLNARKKKRSAGKKASLRETEKKEHRPLQPSGKTETVEEEMQPVLKTVSVERESPENPPAETEELPKGEKTESRRIRLAAALGNLLRRIRGLLLWLVHIPAKIAGRIRKMWLTFRNFCDKIRRWKDFLTRDTTKAAAKFLLGRGRALLVHILPRKVRGKVTVGFEDPAMTGQLLAAAGVFYPLYRDNIQITPVFNRQVLEGDFLLKGRIFGAAFVWSAWKIYRNRDVRTTWQGFRNKEA